jgi:hypothetical protein
LTGRVRLIHRRLVESVVNLVEPGVGVALRFCRLRYLGLRYLGLWIRGWVWVWRLRVDAARNRRRAAAGRGAWRRIWL